MKTIRIFISSPGDVAEERERARQVVEQLRHRYAGQFDLKPVLWEDLPLQADTPFQQGIDVVLSKDEGIDIAVFILWSRLGSPLGAVIRKPDGSSCRSGTEREFDLMMAARERSQTDTPKILVYTRGDDETFHERLRGKRIEEQHDLITQKKDVVSLRLGMIHLTKLTVLSDFYFRHYRAEKMALTGTTEGFWKDLLLAIDDGQVVPIVGRDLLVVETDNAIDYRMISSSSSFGLANAQAKANKSDYAGRCLLFLS